MPLSFDLPVSTKPLSVDLVVSDIAKSDLAVSTKPLILKDILILLS